MVPGNPAPQILLAEDDEEFGAVLEQWLLRHGYGCVWVRDAAGAVRAMEGKAFDLVLSDIDMPGNKGLALVKHVQAHGAGLPVILLTGKPSFETAVGAVGSPVVAYLVKPPEVDDLFRRIEEALATGAVRRRQEGRNRSIEASLALLARFEQRLQAGEDGADLRVELARELRRVTDGERDTPRPPAGDTEDRLRLLEGALREAVAVLEDTRKAFKSKQLGDLRKRLEQLPGLH